jgi:hypothetical protein
MIQKFLKLIHSHALAGRLVAQGLNTAVWTRADIVLSPIILEEAVKIEGVDGGFRVATGAGEGLVTDAGIRYPFDMGVGIEDIAPICSVIVIGTHVGGTAYILVGSVRANHVRTARVGAYPRKAGGHLHDVKVADILAVKGLPRGRRRGRDKVLTTIVEGKSVTGAVEYGRIPEIMVLYE